jgi:photosystem II stability/assembly factor-like uncharacterized protein
MKNNLVALVLSMLLSGGVLGQSWNLQVSFPDTEPSDLLFIDDANGFVLADSSTNGQFITSLLIKTMDGGQTWQHLPINNMTGNSFKCSFLNSNEGFIAGRGPGGNSGMFMKTIDGGLSWTNTASFNEKVLNICFINNQTGWVLGKNGLLQKTTNGGISFSPQSVTSEDLLCMRFFDATTGLLACGGGELYRTIDGGLSWNAVVSGTGDNLTAISINGSNAWICGEAGAIIYSANNGLTWSTQTPVLNVDFSDISFSDSNNGYVGGISGILNNTIDGGITYQSVIASANFDIVGIEMRNTSLGWYLNSNGDLYKYATTAGLYNTLTSRKIKVYPQPANEVIYINFEEFRLKHIEIVDVTGKTVAVISTENNGEPELIDVSDFPSGVYILKSFDQSGMLMNKILIN